MAKRKAAPRTKAKSAMKGMGSGMLRKAASKLVSGKARRQKKMKDIYK